jgi:hypothetical protein
MRRHYTVALEPGCHLERMHRFPYGRDVEWRNLLGASGLLEPELLNLTR